MQLSDALIYVLEKLNNRGMLWIIGLVVVIIIGYFWLHPIGDAAIVAALEQPEQSAFKSFIKGAGKFFPMLEYGGLSIPFGMFTFSTVLLRLYLMDIMDNVFVQIVVVIRFLLVIFASICRSYARIIIALEGCQVFDAIKKSTALAFNNLGISLKLMVVEVLLLLRFVIIGLLIIGIPLLLISLAVRLEMIDNRFVESLIRIIAVILLLVVAYINCIVEAFFLTYRHKAYRTLKLKESV